MSILLYKNINNWIKIQELTNEWSIETQHYKNFIKIKSTYYLILLLSIK